MAHANEEDAVQQVVARYLDLAGVLYCHVPNGGYRHPATAARLRSQGVKAGVPDIMVYDAPPRVPGTVGAAMELKRTKGGRVSPAQQAWLRGLANAGWATAVCHGVDEALAMLRDWGYEPRRR